MEEVSNETKAEKLDIDLSDGSAIKVECYIKNRTNLSIHIGDVGDIEWNFSGPLNSDRMKADLQKVENWIGTIDDIGRLQTLKIDLLENWIGKESFFSAAAFFSDAPFLWITNKEVQALLLEFLSTALQKLNNLQRIELRGVTPYLMLQTIFTGAMKLKELSCSNLFVYLGEEYLKIGINRRQLKCTFKDSATVDREFDLIDPANLSLAKFLGSVFPNHTGMHFDDLERGSECRETAAYPEEWLSFLSGPGCPHSITLFLYTIDTCRGVVKGLTQLQPASGLRKLNLMAYLAEPDFGEELVRFLEGGQNSCSALEELTLNCNFSRDRRENENEKMCNNMRAVAEALGVNKHLRAFRLEINKHVSRETFYDAFAEAFLPSIQGNPRLTCVELPYYKRDSDHVKNIRTHVAINQFLQDVTEEQGGGSPGRSNLLWAQSLAVAMRFGKDVGIDFIYLLLRRNPSILPHVSNVPVGMAAMPLGSRKRKRRRARKRKKRKLN